MNINWLLDTTYRIFFAGAFILLILGVAERTAFRFGYTITGGLLSGGRLLEIASITMLFVIALLVRQIRIQMKDMPKK